MDVPWSCWGWIMGVLLVVEGRGGGVWPEGGGDNSSDECKQNILLNNFRQHKILEWSTFASNALLLILTKA